MKTIAPPVIIPASAPHFVVRFQNRENSTTGPNAAPKPAQANDTIVNTESSFHAQNTATTAMTTIVRREMIIDFFCDIFSPKTSPRRSFDMLDDAARSWESAVDIVDARMPEIITPVSRAKNMPFSPIFFAISMIIRWEFSAVSEIAPFETAALPMTPINIATPIETTTHDVAMRRDVASFFESLIAIKRSRMCGIPK